jgi:hypothetical protein
VPWRAQAETLRTAFEPYGTIGGIKTVKDKGGE